MMQQTLAAKSNAREQKPPEDDQASDHSTARTRAMSSKPPSGSL